MSLLLTLGLGGSGTPPAPPTGGNTPYMNLLLPIVSVTLGPLYATEVNGAFLRVDAHDHTSGYGKPIPSSGLQINADVPWNNFQITNLKAAGFAIQSPTVGPTGSVYFSGQDFYVVDGTGTPIQITAAGAVNVTGLGSWTGLTAPAQAKYSSVSKKFTLLSNTSGPKHGLLEVGDILLYSADPSTSGVFTGLQNGAAASYTLITPAALPASPNKGILQVDYTGQMSIGPAVPSPAPAFLRMSATGNLAADVTVDTGTMQLAGGGPFVLGVKPQGVGSVQIANQAVTATQQAAPRTGSAPVNFFGTNVHTVPLITIAFQTSNLQPSFNARPILVTFGPTPGGGGGVSGGSDLVLFEILVDGFAANPGGASWSCDFTGATTAQLPPVAFMSYVIPPGTISAGSHTWQFRATSTAGIGVAGTLSVTEL